MQKGNYQHPPKCVTITSDTFLLLRLAKSCKKETGKWRRHYRYSIQAIWERQASAYWNKLLINMTNELNGTVYTDILTRNKRTLNSTLSAILILIELWLSKIRLQPNMTEVVIRYDHRDLIRYNSTQLNSRENYGRRCLTPLSPHHNYILS